MITFLLLLVVSIYLLGVSICCALLESIKQEFPDNFKSMNNKDKCIVFLLLIGSWLGVFYLLNKTML